MKTHTLTDLKQHLQIADRLAHAATKEDLAECARLLAINVAHYESRYGQLPLDETLAMAYADEPNVEQVQLLISGMVILVGVLGGIVQGFDAKTSH